MAKTALQLQMQAEARLRILNLFTRRELDTIAEHLGALNSRGWDLPMLKAWLASEHWLSEVIDERVKAKLDTAREDDG